MHSPLTAIPSFQDRADSGFYDNLAVKFDASDESLATVDFGKDFTSESVQWRNGDVKNYRTTFNTLGISPQEMVVTLIAEVAQEGSELGARGNTFLRSGSKITDKSNTRDLLVLVCPTLATGALAVLYENQLSTLELLFDISLPVPIVSINISTNSSSLILLDRRIKLPIGLAPQMNTGLPSMLFCPRNIKFVKLCSHRPGNYLTYLIGS